MRKYIRLTASYQEIWRKIHRGRMPQLVTNKAHDWQMFYGAYVCTYIECDVHDLTQVGDEGKFLRLMISTAPRTGNLLNLAELARDNLIKRAVKTPNMYFLDTELAAYLTRWNNPETLQHGAMSESFFESLVISEILSSYYNKEILEPPLWFYWDKDIKKLTCLLNGTGFFTMLRLKKH